MNKLLPFLVLVSLSIFSLEAQKITWGLGPDISFSSTGETSGTNNASKNDLRFGVFAPIFLSEAWEVTPTLAVTQHSESDPGNFAAGISTDLSRWGVSLGAGAYYNFIKAGPVSIKAGAQGSFSWGFKPSGTSATNYESYFNLGFGIVAPVILDLNMTENLVLRISQPVVSLSMNRESRTIAGAESSSGSLGFQTIQTGFTPSFAVYWIFK